MTEKIRKNIFLGGGPNSPVSITKVPSSGVIILVVEEDKSKPAPPAVALHSPIAETGGNQRWIVVGVQSGGAGPKQGPPW